LQELELLFVYGTLRRDCGGGMHRYLADHAMFVGEALCRGRLYLLDGYPGAVADDSGSSLVQGELYRLQDPAATLATIDAYEECGTTCGAENEYVRTITRVVLADGTEAEAWIYYYNRPVDGLMRVNSGDFCKSQQGV